jgi:hypothetical protein
LWRQPISSHRVAIAFMMTSSFWADPNIDHAAWLLSKIYRNRAAALRRANVAREVASKHAEANDYRAALVRLDWIEDQTLQSA